MSQEHVSGLAEVYMSYHRKRLAYVYTSYHHVGLGFVYLYVLLFRLSISLYVLLFRIILCLLNTSYDQVRFAYVS